MAAHVRILLISGSTRRGSGNTAALRTVQAMAPEGITAEIYPGLALLPAFSPDEDGACVRVPVPRDAAGPDGIIADPAIRAAFGAALAALGDRARG